MKHYKNYLELLTWLINSDQMKKNMDEVDKMIEEAREEQEHKAYIKRLRQLEGDQYLKSLE